MLRGIHRLVKAAEVADPSTLLRISGHSFSSTWVVKASVPSEPTSRCAMLFGALRGTSGRDYSRRRGAALLEISRRSR